jgi:hypothetical protein
MAENKPDKPPPATVQLVRFIADVLEESAVI